MSKWVRTCAVDDVELEGVKRFDAGDLTLAIYRSPKGDFFATDGHCTHEQVHLADGLVIDYTIECPKHSGLFDYRTGEALAPPVCVHLQCFKVKIEDGSVFVELPS